MPQDYLAGLDPAARRAQWDQVLAHSDWPRAGVLVAEGSTAGQDARGTAAGLAGFVAVCPARDEGEDPSQVAEVAAIYLAPEVWGTGTGRELITAALDALAEAGYRQATLWVLDSNERARRFYQAGGWRLDGAIKTDDRHGFPLTELRYRHPLTTTRQTGHP